MTPKCRGMDQIGAGRAQTGRQDAVGCRGCAAALQVPEYGDARFQSRQFFQLLRQLQGAFGIHQLRLLEATNSFRGCVFFLGRFFGERRHAGLASNS
jgi:hypothetical protein